MSLLVYVVDHKYVSVFVSESSREVFHGYDWLSSTVFLMMGGSLDDSVHFLLPFSTTLSSAYLWLPRMHNSVSLAVDQRQNHLLHYFMKCV